MSDVEEGEIEGELGEAPPPPPPPEQPPHDCQQQQATPQAGPPRERLLAPQASGGRAPYYADPDTNGFKGRGGGGGKKKRKKAAAAGFVDVYGQGASAAIELYRDQGPIRLSDVQGLLLWVLGEGANPRWCFVKNKPLVKKVLMLAAHGLDEATWAAAASAGALPAWRRHLGEPILLQARNATLAPGSTVHALLTVPQTKKRRREDGQQQQQQQQQQEEAGAEAAAAGGGDGLAGSQNGTPATAAVGTPPPQPPAAAGGVTDLHDAAHGMATPADAGAAGGVSEAAGAAADTPAPAAAKRMKVAAGADVSSRVQPQLAGASAAHGAADAEAATEPATEPAAAGGQLAASPGQQQQPRGEDAAAAATTAAGGGQGSGQGGARWRPGALPPSHYVLTLDQLQEHGYPLPAYDGATGEMACPEGFVATRSARGAAPLHDLVALDCEMCITEAGFELTRATLVDRQGQVLLDELCVPHNPITDHNTRYSGITAEMLEGVTTRLADVQASIRDLVAAETLVVAHSGENDLQALKIIHANVIDTSVLFPHPRGPPFKSALRVLASRHLTRTIQQGEHNPVEDARAALDLALLKFERGPAYGAGGGERGERLVEVLGAAGRRTTLVDRLELLNKQVVGDCSAVVAEGDAAVVAALRRELPKPQAHLVWGQLGALQEYYEARLAAVRESGLPEPTAPYRLGPGAGYAGSPRQQQNGAVPPVPAEQQQEQQDWAQPAMEQQQAQALAVLDASLEQLWAAAPVGTLVVVVTGQGDTTYGRYLQEQKWRRQQGLGGHPPWSPACEAHLAAWQARAQLALCFAAVKQQGEAVQAAQPKAQPGAAAVEQSPPEQQKEGS